MNMRHPFHIFHFHNHFERFIHFDPLPRKVYGANLPSSVEKMLEIPVETGKVIDLETCITRYNARRLMLRLRADQGLRAPWHGGKNKKVML